jgi:cobalt-zinc-cadmium efflux system membrane fusion protein
VRAGEVHQGRRVILEGLRPEEEVVVAGAFHLNNERRRRNIRGTD